MVLSLVLPLIWLTSASQLEPLLVLTDPVALRAAEAGGGSLGGRLGSRMAPNSVLHRDLVSYRSVVDVIGRDLAEVRKRDPLAGVGTRFAHRQFDLRWLSSPHAQFELIGIVNRWDRRTFDARSCGETRLIYRLSMSTKMGTSRLPMTVNLVYFQPASSDCSAALNAWRSSFRDGTAAGQWIVSSAGPASDARLSLGALKALEINLQSVRWPSTVRPDMAGHAEYLLRVFKYSNGAFTPDFLENTPDVDRLREDRALRDDLARWIRAPENMRRIDEGTAVLPEQFLSRRALSVAPHGLARWANRPFRQLFAPSDFSDIAFPPENRMVLSATGLLRRLDGLSCAGCHQSRSIAGFHFVGEQPASETLDAIAVAMSPHMHSEIFRRRTYFASLGSAVGVDEFRPSAERDSDGEHGTRCDLSGGAHFRGWGCVSGLACTRIDEEELGLCLSAQKPRTGEPCTYGLVNASGDPHKDRTGQKSFRDCGPKAVCEENSVGFPNGMCSSSCESLDKGATCGAIALLTPFNDCLARNRPFSECLQNNVRPAALQRCGFHEPCREDYVCARTALGEGACIPPYFLFQLRVDGHP